MENDQCQSTAEPQAKSIVMGGSPFSGVTENDIKSNEPQIQTKTRAEMIAIQSHAIRFACPHCKTAGFIPGPPFGRPEKIDAFASGKPLLLKCGKCGTMLELERQIIEAPAQMPRNRHERRAAIVLVK